MTRTKCIEIINAYCDLMRHPELEFEVFSEYEGTKEEIFRMAIEELPKTDKDF